MPRLLVCLLLALLPACMTNAPRLRMEAHQGRVRADQVEAGQVAVQLLDELAPRVRELLPGARERPLEVWVQSELEVYSGWPLDASVPAFTIEDGGRIHLLEANRTDLSFALAHELVHALLDEGWSTLPPVAEEGLADWVQERMHPRERGMLRADHLAKASAAFGGLRFGVFMSWEPYGKRRVASFTLPGIVDDTGELLDPVAALERSDPEPRDSVFQPYRVSVSDSRLYGLGYLVVARIAERRGLQGLYELCLRARDDGLDRVPAAWLLEAADLEGGAEVWRVAIVERFGPAELAFLAGELRHFLAELLEGGLEPFRRSLSDDRELLKRTRPRLALLGGPASLDLVEVPGLFESLLSAWSLAQSWPATDLPGPVSFTQPVASPNALSRGQ